MKAEIVGTEVPPSEEQQSGRKGPAVGQWVRNTGVIYTPDKEAFKDFEIESHDYVKRFAGRKSFTVGRARSRNKETVHPQVDAVLQTPVVFREGGKFYYRWKQTRIVGGMQEAEDFFSSGQGQAKRALEAFGDPFDQGGSGGSQFFTSTPSSPTALIDSNEFIPFLNGPFYKQLYQYDYLQMHARCLAGATPIPLLDGTSRTIQELAEEGRKDFWVYSCDSWGRIVPGLATAAKRTGNQERVVVVHLDSGEEVKCTPDHLFMLRGGEYRRADELLPGDSLMPLYRTTTNPVHKGYEALYQPGLSFWETTHRRVAMNSAGLADWPDKHVVHHVNGNPLDNRPENLLICTRSEHSKIHDQQDPERARRRAALGEGLKRSPETCQKIADKVRLRWQDPVVKAELSQKISRSMKLAYRTGRAVPRYGPRSPLGPCREETKRKISESNKQSWARRKVAALNHKVVRVVDAGYADVYDLTVERYHNFAVGQGVFVHNSFQLVNHAALAAGAVKIMTRFVLGRGISFSIKDEKAQQVWEDFWEANGMRDKVRQMARDMCWQGELMLRFYERQAGRLTVRIIDPSTCWEVVTDPEDFEHVYYYHFQWPCLRGDTRIACLDGTAPTVAELAERQEQTGEPVWVYSYDETTGQVVPGEASKVWRTGVKRCVEVEIDSGEKVTCSWDHPFLLRSGEYVQAEKLRPGDPLKRVKGEVDHHLSRMGWARRKAVAPNNHKVVAVRPAGEHVVYDIQVDKYHNFALACGVFTHNTPYQIWTQGNIPVSKYIIQQVPPTNVQHIKINVSSQEKRGRSDLLPAMPWLKRFDDYYNGAVMKAVLEANLVYKVKVHGDQADINTIQNDPSFTIMPPPGGTWLENDAVDMTPLSAVMSGAGGRGGQAIGQQIASIVATSLNLPTEYFNIEGGAGGARATALVRTDPAVKAVEDRQQILRESLEDIYDRVIEAAIREGILDVSAARRDPEIVPDEQQVDDERSEDKDLEFTGSAHAPQVPSKPVVRASFPGRPVRPVRATFRG